MKFTEVLNLTNDDYHNSNEYKKFWSSSNIKEYLNSPREAYYQKFQAVKTATDAMSFGTQLHDYLASKHIKGQPFDYNIFEPPINPKTLHPYGKLTKTYQDALSFISNPISADDMELLIDIWDMIMNSGYRWFFEQQILNKGVAEASFFVESGPHKYKYRPDVVTDKFLFDYKTMAKNYWRQDKIQRKILDYGYDISAAMYQFFEHQRTGIWKPFYIIWIMKEPPYDILLSDISEHCFETFGKDNNLIINSGAMMFKALKDQHELCEVSNQWPGIANQFDKFNGLRLANFAPKYTIPFEPFEID